MASESGYQLGTYLTCVTDVSDSAIEAHNWNGILKLTIICESSPLDARRGVRGPPLRKATIGAEDLFAGSTIQFLPVFGIYLKTPGGVALLPNSIEDTKAQCDTGRRTPAGAWAFYALFFASIAFSAGQSFYLAVVPDGLCPDKSTDDD